MTYQEYIDNLIESKYEGDARTTLGKCMVEVPEMNKRFPELKEVRGFVYVEWFAGHQRERKREHWWLESPDGDIIDPTAGQFPVIEQYEAYEKGMDVRVGTCVNCGESLWGPPGTYKQFCGEICEDSYRAYIQGGVL